MLQFSRLQTWVNILAQEWEPKYSTPLLFIESRTESWHQKQTKDSHLVFFFFFFFFLCDARIQRFYMTVFSNYMHLSASYLWLYRVLRSFSPSLHGSLWLLSSSLSLPVSISVSLHCMRVCSLASSAASTLLQHLWNLSFLHYFCRSPLCSISLPPVRSLPLAPRLPRPLFLSMILICILAIQLNCLWLCNELTSYYFFSVSASVRERERKLLPVPLCFSVAAVFVHTNFAYISSLSS